MRQNRTHTTLDRNSITIDPTFRHRSGPDSGTHLAALRKTLRNTGRLDPVLVWQEADSKGTATGRLVLIDGHYRLAAYRAEQSAGKIEGRGVPAVLLTGSRMEAHLDALTANSKGHPPADPYRADERGLVACGDIPRAPLEAQAGDGFWR